MACVAGIGAAPPGRGAAPQRRAGGRSRAGAKLALAADVATMGMDNMLGDRQSEAGPRTRGTRSCRRGRSARRCASGVRTRPGAEVLHINSTNASARRAPRRTRPPALPYFIAFSTRLPKPDSARRIGHDAGPRPSRRLREPDPNQGPARPESRRLPRPARRPACCRRSL